MPKPSLNPRTVRARQLRREMTDAERKLWKYLRARQLNEVKFRRQEPLATYVVDFCCFDPKLVIEVDGGQHAEQVDYNPNAPACWSGDVPQNIEGVFETISGEIERLRARK